MHASWSKALIPCLCAIASFSAFARGADLLRQDFENRERFRPGANRVDDNARGGGVWNGFDGRNFSIAADPDRPDNQVLKITRAAPKVLTVNGLPATDGRDATVRFRAWLGNTNQSAFAIRFGNQKANAVAGEIRFSADNIVTGVANGRTYFGVRSVPDASHPTPGWREYELVFPANAEKYRIGRFLPDGTLSKGLDLPYENPLPVDRIEFITMPAADGVDNTALVDDIRIFAEDALSLAGRQNVLLAANDAKAFLVGSNGEHVPAPALNDGDVAGESVAGVEGLPGDIVFDLPQAAVVSSFRLYSGVPGYRNNPSGDLSARAYKVEALVVGSGAWRELFARENLPGSPADLARDADFFDAVDFEPIEVERLRVTFLASNDTGRRADPNTPSPKTAVIREVELYTRDAVDNQRKSLANVLQAELRLPVYRYQDTAQLYAVLDESIPELTVELSVKERHNGAVPTEAWRAALKPGENVVPIDIRGWANGEYRVSVRAAGRDAPVGGEFGRLLRLDRLEDPRPPPGATAMTGLKMYFPDGWHLEQAENVAYGVMPPEVHRAGRPFLAPGEVVQLGQSMHFDAEGRLVIALHGMNYDWEPSSTVRRYLRSAAPDKFDAWEVLDAQPPVAARPAGALQRAQKRGGGGGGPHYSLGDGNNYRFYDAERDGPVDLSAIKVQHVGYKPIDWGIVKPQRQSTWVMWPKGDEILLLQRTSFLQDSISSEEFETPFTSNDNFAGQWLSEDGKTFFYIRGRTLMRYPPFTARYDNLWRIARVLTVFTTRNGVDWERNYFSLPDERDPPTAQHYGASIFSLPDAGGLMIAYTMPYSALHQQFHCEISYSWDGRVWKRFEDRKPWAPPGKPGDWNFGHTSPGPHFLFRGGRMHQLITWGEMAPHFAAEITQSGKLMAELDGAMLERRYRGRDLEKWPFFPHYGSYEKLAEAIKTFGITPGVLISREDGWFPVRVEAGRTARFTTRPVTAEGALAANIRVGAGGYCRVDLLGADGKPLDGYAKRFEEGEDGIRLPVFKALPAGEFRVRVDMKNSELYTLDFGAPPNE